MKRRSQFLLIVTLSTVSLVHSQWVGLRSSNLWGYPQCMAIDGPYLFLGMIGGVFLSADNGTTWKPVNTGLPVHNMMRGPDVRALAMVGSTLFVGTYADGVYRSTNKGASWERVSAGLPADIAIFSLAAAGPYLFAGTHSDRGEVKGLYVLADSGKSWIPSNNGMPLTNVFALAAHGSTLFAGTLHGAFRSTDYGKDWSLIIPAMSSGSFAMDGNRIIAGTPDGIYVSTDDGSRWTSLGKWGLPSEVGSPHVAVSGNALFAGFDNGEIFMSKDNGSTWSDISEGLTPGDEPSFLASDATNLFAGLFFTGIWRRPLAQMVTSVPGLAGATPREFALMQNYPNPFNPKTRIQYTIAGAGGLGLGANNTKLVVYDLLGREVAVLVDEDKQPGNYSVQFDGSGLASGTYIYRLTAGSVLITKKLLLVK